MYLALIVIFQYSAMVWSCFPQLLICPTKTTRSLCKFHPEADTCIRSGLQVSKKHMFLPLSLVKIQYCGEGYVDKRYRSKPWTVQGSSFESCVRRAMSSTKGGFPGPGYMHNVINFTCEDTNLKSHYTYSDVITNTRRSPNAVFSPTLGQHYL